MKIAIIGAGVAGLASIHECLNQNQGCVAFETTGNLGGTWQYTDNVGIDENGLPVHSSMYQGLITNLPKELMEFKGFPYKEEGRSFLTQPEVLNYLNQFADKYDLRKHIKFFKHVVEVNPEENDKWKVKVKDLKSGQLEESTFDAIMVCVGTYSVPRMPEVRGLENFKDHYTHSHSYRKPDQYKDKRVLIVGGGISGTDISRLLLNTAKKVYISCGNEPPVIGNRDGVTVKGEVTSLLQCGMVEFEDGSLENIDDIIFCTGYCYSFPFLTPKCGIKVEDKWVQYLYKHIVNIEHPTMAFIGIPLRVCPILVIDHQTRFAVAFLQKKFTRTKEEMMDDLEKEMERRKGMGYPLRHAHKLGVEQGAYFDDLSEIAGIEKMPKVFQKLYDYHKSSGNLQARFKIVDDEHFVEF